MKQLEYVGPFRKLRQIPRKVANVYDENIGRTKTVTANWQETDDGRLISQPLPESMVQRIVESPMFVIYDKNKKPELVKISIVTPSGDAASKEEAAQLRAKLREMERENVDLRMKAGRGVVPKDDDEKKRLSPKKK